MRKKKGSQSSKNTKKKTLSLDGINKGDKID